MSQTLAKQALREAAAKDDRDGLSAFLPEQFRSADLAQTELPRLAKDPCAIKLIRDALCEVPTEHSLHLGDARGMHGVQSESVHLVLTSPPYWNLKDYR